jgi:hypothetical protein
MACSGSMPVAVIKTSCRGGGQPRVRRRMRAIRNVSLPSTILYRDRLGLFTRHLLYQRRRWRSLRTQRGGWRLLCPFRCLAPSSGLVLDFCFSLPILFLDLFGRPPDKRRDISNQPTECLCWLRPVPIFEVRRLNTPKTDRWLNIVYQYRNEHASPFSIVGFFLYPTRLDRGFGPQDDDAARAIKFASNRLAPCLTNWDRPKVPWPRWSSA